jgi:23S rRNA pseudouridine2605 synthase
MTSSSSTNYPLRLQKFLARAGVASRRGSEDLMTAGRVTVNGEVATQLGTKVDPARDDVRVDGKPVLLGSQNTYIMLNKPAGHLTTMDDPQGRPTVRELIPISDHPGLFPVGRLDYDTTGLLLFTTDGELAHQLLHPRHHVAKRYIAQVDGVFTDKDGRTLAAGVTLHDGPTAPAQVELLGVEAKKLTPRERLQSDTETHKSTVAITITEGRKRQVKRMCAHVGHPVLNLHREAFGPLTLGDLEPGEWRYLTQEEIEALTNAV